MACLNDIFHIVRGGWFRPVMIIVFLMTGSLTGADYAQAQDGLKDSFSAFVRQKLSDSADELIAYERLERSMSQGASTRRQTSSERYLTPRLYNDIFRRWLILRSAARDEVISLVDEDPTALANARDLQPSNFEPRVVGVGARPANARFRETVAILQTADMSGPSGLSSICTGILVSDLTVLTAAHCVCNLRLTSPAGRRSARVAYGAFADRAESFTVTLGDPQSQFALRFSSAVDIEISPLLYNPNFCTAQESGRTLLGEDIALVFLKDKKADSSSSDTEIDPHRSKAVFAPRALVAAKNLKSMTVVGYGISDFIDETGTKYGKVAVVVPVADATCTGAYARQNYRCAPGREAVLVDWHKSRDTCNGDSGGPAFIRYANAFYLAGVTSRAATVGECGEGGIYTLLTPRKQLWIQRNKRFSDPTF